MEMPMPTPKEIPPGFIFKPTDAELVSHYLYKKINGEYFTSWNYIKDGNIYGEEAPSHPSKLFEGSSSDELYFFAKVKKKHNKSIGKKLERRAGNGTWVIKTPTTKVYDKNDKSHVIGYKAYLKFIVKSPQQALENDKIKKPQCQWQMYEYKLKDVLFTPENNGNDSKLVVCVIKKGKLLSTSDNPPSPSLSERTWTDDEFNRPYKKHTGHRSPSSASKKTAYNEGLVQQEGKEKLLDSSDDSPSLLPPIMPGKWGKSSLPYKKHTRRRSPSLASKMTAYNEKLVQQKGKEKLLDSSDNSPSPTLPPFMPGKWGKSSMPYKKHTHRRSPPLASKATAYSEGLVQQKGKEKLLDISDDSPSPPPPIMPGKWGKSSMPYKKHTRSRSSCAARGAPTPAPTTISKSDVDCIDELPQPWS